MLRYITAQALRRNEHILKRDSNNEISTQMSTCSIQLNIKRRFNVATGSLAPRRLVPHSRRLPGLHGHQRHGIVLHPPIHRLVLLHLPRTHPPLPLASPPSRTSRKHLTAAPVRQSVPPNPRPRVTHVVNVCIGAPHAGSAGRQALARAHPVLHRGVRRAPPFTPAARGAAPRARSGRPRAPPRGP